MSDGCPRLCIGLDVGTTNIKLVVTELHGEGHDDLGDKPARVLFSSEETISYDPAQEPTHKHQNPAKFVELVRQLLDAVPLEMQKRVARLGVAGQMHGCVLWDQDGPCSPLITWQDERCDAAFLVELRQSTGRTLHSGYGCATLAWLAKYNPTLLSKATGCGTIMDFLVCEFLHVDSGGTQGRRARMDQTNAASWGLFDRSTGGWDHRALTAVGIPLEIMPKVVAMGNVGENAMCGEVRAVTLFRVHEQLPDAQRIALFAAVGDHPASVYGTMPRRNSGSEGRRLALLNIGTSSQFSAVLGTSTRGKRRQRGQAHTARNAGTEIRPFFHGREMLVAAALSGGNSLEIFARSVQGWLHQAAVFTSKAGGATEDGPALSMVYKLLNHSLGPAMGEAEGMGAQEGSNASSGGSCAGTTKALVFDPRFTGERGSPDARASLGNIDSTNFTLGGMWQALLHGVIRNLVDLVGGREAVDELQLDSILCVGGAVAKNSALLRCVEGAFGIRAEIAPSTGFAGALGVAQLVSEERIS